MRFIILLKTGIVELVSINSQRNIQNKQKSQKNQNIKRNPVEINIRN